MRMAELALELDMADDLVKRLREENSFQPYYGVPAIQNEAADRIEALEKALCEIADCKCEKWCGNYFNNCIARAALEKKDD